MKLFGMLLVLGGFLGLAFLYTERMRRRLRILEEWGEILELIEGEIQFGRSTLPECFLMVGAQHVSALGRHFEDLGEKILNKPQKNLLEEWDREWREELGFLFSETEYKKFFRCMAPQGHWDEKMQRRTLARTRERVDEMTEKMKREYHGKSRVAYSLGALAGMFVVLLLI